MSEELTNVLNADLIRRGVSWLSAAGDDADVVISSRIRLARNLAGFPFLTRATRPQREAVLARVRERIAAVKPHAGGARLLWVDVHQTTQADRTLMVERHLISKEHAKGDEPRGVAISLPDEQVCLMVNEEDQLRLQALRPGLQIAEAFTEINNIDDQLCGRSNTDPPAETPRPLEYAFSPRFGFLTACPTNVGTGMRVSVMLHLPALRLTGEMEKVRRATKDMNLAVRGYYGEGSEATGELYQISNQTTLGKSEQVIMHDLEHEILPQVIGYERKARALLIEKRRRLLEDTVYRALGILRHARLLTPEESLTLLSNVRLGVLAGLVSDVQMDTINQLILLTQPAHLQRALGAQLDQAARREARADLVRERLAPA